ncbi:MAG: sulfatase-like hydrolase/transferase [Pigmentiphaga sp.]|nr:sulfatase-like hydrolase/transferase [Pigmentiphaga sp.]
MKKPNIIFILADDLGYADLGCYGARDSYNQSIDVSPNIDRMAAEGIKFKRGYANSAVCSPTRFALLTGRWQYRLRGAADEPLGPAYGDKILGLPPEHPTLPSLLRQSGYRTALIGKWHLGYPPHFGPLLSGYDEFFGFYGGGIDYFAHTGPKGGSDLWLNDERVQRKGYITDLLSQEAVDFINNESGERPFFISLHYSAPHWPWLSRDDEAESVNSKARGWHPDGGSIATYQKMIHHMDEGVGWVLEALKNKGFDDNTLIVFTSDNGGERFSNSWPLYGEKMDLLEGGIRVPLIARWPRGIEGGKVSDCLSMTMDWTATLLEIAGASCDDSGFPLDGVSLAPLFKDAGWRRPGDLCWRMKHRAQRALIREDWKYLHQDGYDFLFDLAVDPRERANLAHRFPEVLADLRASWLDWNSALPAIPGDAKVFKLLEPGDMASGSGTY